MCLIAVSQRGAPEFEARELDALLQENPHGIGLAWVAHGRLHMWKELTPFVENVLAVFGTVSPASPCLLHIRQATCGPVGLGQVQPLMVDEPAGLVFAHNGTLSGLGGAGASDSQEFARRVVAPAVSQAGGPWRGAVTLSRISAQIPAGNRAVLLDRKGTLEIFRAEEGFFYRNMWLSNPKMRQHLAPHVSERVGSLGLAAR